MFYIYFFAKNAPFAFFTLHFEHKLQNGVCKSNKYVLYLPPTTE